MVFVLDCLSEMATGLTLASCQTWLTVHSKSNPLAAWQVPEHQIFRGVNSIQFMCLNTPDYLETAFLFWWRKVKSMSFVLTNIKYMLPSDMRPQKYTCTNGLSFLSQKHFRIYWRLQTNGIKICSIGHWRKSCPLGKLKCRYSPWNLLLGEKNPNLTLT